MSAAVLAAVLAAAAVWILLPGPARRRLHRLRGVSAVRRLDVSLAAVVLVAVLGLLLAGPVGGVVALAFAPLVRRQVARMGTVADRRREAAMVRQAPLALDLMAAVLAAGKPAGAAVQVVGEQTPDPLGAHLREVARRLRTGTDPVAAWHTLDGPGLHRIGRAFARSELSGAGVVAVARDAAEEVRRRANAERREAVSRVGVRSTVPLGLCLLPAFVLIAIAPTVLAMVGSLLPS